MQSSVLPSFSEQIAYVYDDYMDTLGGGERSAMAYALALKMLGFTTEIISRRPLPTHDQLRTLFGEEFAGITMRKIDCEDVSGYLSSSEPTVFINHTYMSFAANPAKVGIYSQMFPNNSISTFSHPKEWRNLYGYQLMLSNSSFTKNYADWYLNFPSERSFVLHPPIGSEFIQTAQGMIGRPLNKKMQFVNIGRFNPGNHNKNQKILMETFLEAKSRNPLLKEWKLICVGNANQTPEAIVYLNDCKQIEAKNRDSIVILNNIDAGKLGEILLESFAYVHGTGAFIPPGTEPHKCEHLGLGIIEAMAHGCIPLVYARGGVFDVLKPGQMGIPYITRKGLVDGYGVIAAFWGKESAEKMQQRNLQATLSMGQRTFTERLAKYITEALA